MKHILEELVDLEQKRQFMLQELIAEIIVLNPEEFEGFELTNRVGIALDDSWDKRKGEHGSRVGYYIAYSLACDGAYFNEDDILYQDIDYTLVYAEVYDDSNRYSGLILISTKNFKGETQ